jgi:hypothetical protein
MWPMRWAIEEAEIGLPFDLDGTAAASLAKTPVLTCLAQGRMAILAGSGGLIWVKVDNGIACCDLVCAG